MVRRSVRRLTSPWAALALLSIEVTFINHSTSNTIEIMEKTSKYAVALY